MAPSPATGTATTTTTTTTTTTGVIPARLAFLAIYNPSLGVTDETIDDQILYYYSSSASAAPSTPSPSPRHRRRSRSGADDGDGEGDGDGDGGRNERLRQIGLAQGMVEFGRGFSGGSAVDAVDTERSRVVLRELEDGWWILAVGFIFLALSFFIGFPFLALLLDGLSCFVLCYSSSSSFGFWTLAILLHFPEIVGPVIWEKKSRRRKC